MEERSDIWKGRITNETDGTLYYYQHVKELSNHDIVRGSVVLVGYNFDEGVRRNQGRVGAADGPDQIRRMLAKCAINEATPAIYDFGNLFDQSSYLHDAVQSVEKAQNRLARTTERLLNEDAWVINMGGGHDMSFGTALGLYRAYPDQKIGVINFDAHLDLRRSTMGVNSGTPFYQILSELKSLSYLPIGIQKETNTKDLFKTAQDHGVNIIYDDDSELDSKQSFLEMLEGFLNEMDIIHLSIDLDVFSSSYAPGVSAPNPIGVHPKMILRLIKNIIGTGKCKAVDIAEMNPTYDLDDRTARLAARIICKIIDALG
ncbi:formimidoylglutamase [Portibacter marinus]|uniref:formimidoylglutamase n=1 Tax=Portibacter marinus TaxID=2898660 RepID=UPI001F425D77|nr:formimidoylglutamase [Portibacter marinus]